MTYAADPETKSDLQKDSYGTEAYDNSGEDVATQEYVRAKLKVNGKSIISEEGKLVGDMPAGMSYDDSTNTLTLNNCTLEQTQRPAEMKAGLLLNLSHLIIQREKKLTIVLKETILFIPGPTGIVTGLDDSVTIKGTGR